MRGVASRDAIAKRSSLCVNQERGERIYAHEVAKGVT